MKRVMVALCLLALSGIFFNAHAIDREARMIDWASLDMAYLDETDSIGGSIWGETALATSWQEWAFLFGGGYGTISPEASDNVNYWTLGLGLKFYATPVTGISILGRIDNYMDTGDDRVAKGVTASIRQRLLPADWSVSPFVDGGLTFRDRSTFTAEGTENSFSEYLVRAGGGCDFAMTDELSFRFEGYYQIADASEDGAEDLDGLIIGVSMVYYWY